MRPPPGHPPPQEKDVRGMENHHRPLSGMLPRRNATRPRRDRRGARSRRLRQPRARPRGQGAAQPEGEEEEEEAQRSGSGEGGAVVASFASEFGSSEQHAGFDFGGGERGTPAVSSPGRWRWGASSPARPSVAGGRSALPGRRERGHWIHGPEQFHGWKRQRGERTARPTPTPSRGTREFSPPAPASSAAIATSPPSTISQFSAALAGRAPAAAPTNHGPQHGLHGPANRPTRDLHRPSQLHQPQAGRQGDRLLRQRQHRGRIVEERHSRRKRGRSPLTPRRRRRRRSRI
mmetsp:Transcript_30570/g.52199  ORF Transcript_30570/g.52199 Transcript_30570/m.52199 type:complete len:290 (-) Transcript_30570:2-871(-)